MAAGALQMWSEAQRLASLRSYGILDTAQEQGFDDLVRLAADICAAPISALALVDAERQWCKARVGGGRAETPRSMSFSQYAMLGEDVMVVADATLDPRFAANPLVVGEPAIRFYAGAPLVSPEGHPLGALCVAALEPRQLSERQAGALGLLGRQVMAQLALRRTVQSLTASDQRFRTVFHRAPIGMVVVTLAPDHLGTLLEVNAGFAAMLGYPSGVLVGRCFFDFIDPDDVAGVRAGFAGVLPGAGRDGHRDQCRLLPASGRPILAQVAGAWMAGEEGMPARLVVQVEDVTVTRAAHDELAHLAAHDPLTGLANRTEVLKRLRQAQSRAGVGSAHVGLLFIDLDRFKLVNDSLGHQAGDELLVVVAGRLTDVIRSGDLAARIGGDEFVVICDDLGPTAAVARRRAEALALRITTAITAPVELGGAEVCVSASVGIALSPGAEQPVEELLRNADAAMYSAKALGCGRVETFAPAHRELAAQRYPAGA